MASFLAGIGCAALLAAVTLWALETGTVTMVERSSDLSTRIGGVWAEGSQPFPEPVDAE